MSRNCKDMQGCVGMCRDIRIYLVHDAATGQTSRCRLLGLGSGFPQGRVMCPKILKSSFQEILAHHPQALKPEARKPKYVLIWVVVEIMVPFRTPMIIRHLRFRVPKRHHNLTTTHIPLDTLMEPYIIPIHPSYNPHTCAYTTS